MTPRPSYIVTYLHTDGKHVWLDTMTMYDTTRILEWDALVIAVIPMQEAE